MPEMTVEEAIEWGKTLSFEKVWAAFMENRKQFAETDRKIAELVAQSQVFRKEQAETSRMIKELTKNVGGINHTLGKWSEEMVAAQLWEKFDVFGYEFTKGGPREKFRENKKIIAEVDVFLENGDFVMAVETKVELEPKDVDEHIERIKKVRQYMNRRNDNRIIVGAMAGAIVSDSARDYTLNKGLYVIKQSGESIALVKPPKDFKPRTWTAA